MRVALFVTCLVDWLAPEVGEAVVRLFDRLGVDVDFPSRQTCCGQPLFNCGFRREARGVAEHFLEVFGDAEAIVVPSGSCGAMVQRHFHEVLDGERAKAAQALAARTYELSQFLTEVLGVVRVGAKFPGRVTYHDSCHLLRELGVRDGPRRLLAEVEGLELVELPDSNVCCGFGGAFSVRLPSVSTGILADKVGRVAETGARTLVASDLSCLLHMKGALAEIGVEVRHLAEVLAGEGP